LNGIDFSPGRMGGIETYFRNLVHFLQAGDRVNRYTILCTLPHGREFAIRNPAFSIREYGAGSRSVSGALRAGIRLLGGMDLLSPSVRKFPADVIHHPFSVIRPVRAGKPAVLTFWDMQHVYYPEFFPARELRRRNREYRRSAGVAARIIVSAEFTRRCLVEQYGINEDKVDVIPIGYGPEFRPIDDPEVLSAIRRRFGLERPFLFYPAATWPHKNHRRLLAALRILRERNRWDGELVLTGVAKEFHADLLEEIGRAGLRDTVRPVGYVPREELPVFYNLARLLVFPSLFEGFGIPVLEAMACGCPVACSRATTLPEVVGDAGILFDPESPEDIAEKVGQVLRDEKLMEEMKRRGLERAKGYSWERAASETVRIYEKAVAGTGRH